MAEAWEDELSDEDFVIDRVTADRFGVLSNLMGNHDADSFSILGRIVALAATLDNKILAFLQHLVGRSQQTHTELSVGQLIERALKNLHRLPPADREFAEAFLREAKAITTKRNDYVHNMWPAQGDGSLVGWRVPQRKAAQASIMTRITIDDMRDDLGCLVACLRSTA